MPGQTGQEHDVHYCSDLDTIAWLISRHQGPLTWSWAHQNGRVYACLPNLHHRALPRQHPYALELSDAAEPHENGQQQPDGTVAVASDMLVGQIDGPGLPEVHLAMRVAACPDSVELPSELAPPHGWEVTIATGHSAHAVTEAITTWAATRTGRRDLTVTYRNADHDGEPQLPIAIGEHAWATSDALDSLLHSGPDRAAEYETYALNLFTHLRHISGSTTT